MSVEIPVFVLPGGKMPETHHNGEDVGYDLFTRALVSLKMDSLTPAMRQTLCDFFWCKSPLIPEMFFCRKGWYGKYKLDPISRSAHPIILGFGVVLGLPYDWYAEIWPRTSMAGICLELSHKGIPIDPGFRGEFVTGIRNNGSEPFFLERHQRIAQLRFHGPNGDFRPALVQVKRFNDLPPSNRGLASHGSTGR